jgi:hypothetical protein
MGLIKHHEHRMNELGIILLKIVLGLARPTLLSSLEIGKMFVYMPNIR